MSEEADPPDEEASRGGPLVAGGKGGKGRGPTERASGLTVVAVIFAAVVFVYLIRSILFPFVMAGALAFVCTPLIDRLSARARLPRSAAAALVFVVLVAAFGVLGTLAVPYLVDEVKVTITNLQGTIQHVIEGAVGSGEVDVLGRRTDAAQLAGQAMEGLRRAVLQGDVIELLAGGGAAAVLSLILTLVLLFFFLAGGPVIGRGLFALVPPGRRPFVEAIWARLSPVLFRYFAGVALVALYASVAASIGLGLFLHLKDALILALIAGLAETIPVVGPLFSATLAGFAAIRGAHGYGDVVAYIVYAVLLRLSIDEFVGPLILGRAGRIHPTLIIFCSLTGAVLLNVVGVVLAIPVALTIKTVLATLYEEPRDQDQDQDEEEEEEEGRKAGRLARRAAA